MSSFFGYVTRALQLTMIKASRINSLNYKYFYMGGFILDAHRHSLA